MEALEVLSNSLDAAQNELTGAEIALIEATARAEAAREAQARLKSAVAALSGEPPPAAAPVAVETVIGVATAEDTLIGAEDTPIPSDRTAAADMTPEEFDAERKRKQRLRKREEMANNPFAHIKCSGCGQMGTMADVIMQAPSGAPVRMMVCGSCNNQVMN